MGLRPYWDPISSSDASMFLITECKSNKIGSKIVTISLCTVLGSLLLTSFNLLLHMDEEEDNYRGESDGGDKELEVPLIDFSTLMDATHNLSTENLLEKGGFGPVYKGKLGEGQEIAVKRLSRTSVQGINEFKNEITLIAKLQHRNLVRFLGYCINVEEVMLIYEYMANKSLDTFLFGPGLGYEGLSDPQHLNTGLGYSGLSPAVGCSSPLFIVGHRLPFCHCLLPSACSLCCATFISLWELLMGFFIFIKIPDSKLFMGISKQATFFLIKK